MDYGLWKYQVVIPACGRLRRSIGHDGGEFGNALKDDPEGGYLPFDELSAMVILNWGGAANRYAAVSIKLETDFFCEILGMYGNERSSQEIEKDI